MRFFQYREMCYWVKHEMTRGWGNSKTKIHCFLVTFLSEVQSASCIIAAREYSQEVALTMANIWNCHLHKSIPMNPNRLQATSHKQNPAELYPY